MTNRVSLDAAPGADMIAGSGEASTEDPFRRVADIIETRGRGDIWSEPDVKLADADEEREAATSVPLEDQEGIDDPVRMYLREIGKVFLLSAADEKRLARQMEEAKYLKLLDNQWNVHYGYRPSATDMVVAMVDRLRASERPMRTLAARHEV